MINIPEHKISNLQHQDTNLNHQHQDTNLNHQHQDTNLNHQHQDTNLNHQHRYDTSVSLNDASVMIVTSDQNKQEYNISKENKHQRLMASLNYAWFLTALIIFVFLVFHIHYEPAFQHTWPCLCLIDNGYPQPNTTYSILNENTTEIQCTQNASSNCAQNCEKTCMEMCTNLALKRPGLYRKEICNKKNNVYRYLGNLYYRYCNKKIWITLNVKLEVCCQEGVDYNCRPGTGFP